MRVSGVDLKIREVALVEGCTLQVPFKFGNRSYRRGFVPLMKWPLSTSSLTFPTLDVQLTYSRDVVRKHGNINYRCSGVFHF